MRPALSQVCSLHSPFGTDLAEYAAGHCEAIDVWLTKLETHVQSTSVDATRRLLDEHGIRAPVASFQGGLLMTQGEARQESWKLFEGRLELCAKLNIVTLVVACDVVAPNSQQDLDRAQVSLKQAAERAAEHDVRLALEFQARAGFGNNLQTAAAWVAEVNHPNLGLCLDTFHFYVGPSKTEDLHYLSKENLFHVQFCDLADTPREFASDSDRILPGDGDIPLPAIVARLHEIEYEDYVALELMNPQIWQVPPRQVGEIGMTALRTVLGQARME